MSSKRIPTQLTPDQFEQFIFSYLSKPRRGPIPKPGFYKVFTYILRVLYTGMQWQELEIDQTPSGEPEIHYTNVWRQHRKWSRDGSYERVFAHSLEKLKALGVLGLEVLHGDGSKVVAKKGALMSGIRDTKS
jgi:transposase